MGARPLHVARARAGSAAGGTYDAECELTVGLAGMSIVMSVSTLVRVAFADGDAYEWGRAPTTLHDGLRGPRAMWLQHAGAVTVTAAATGAAVELEIGERGRSRSRAVRGRVAGTRITLAGAWDEGLTAHDESTSTSHVLWTCVTGDGAGERHALTAWTAGLNEAPRPPHLLPPSVPPPPPSDSRWRPDARALEDGRWTDAAEAAAAAAAGRKGEEARHAGAAWFRAVAPPGTRPGRDALVYEYGGAYWGARAARAQGGGGGGGVARAA